MQAHKKFEREVQVHIPLIGRIGIAGHSIPDALQIDGYLFRKIAHRGQFFCRIVWEADPYDKMSN